MPDKARTGRDHRAPNRHHDLSLGSRSCRVRSGRTLCTAISWALALTFASLVAGTGFAAPSAYADVSSAQYAIGSPSNSVGNVVASPSTMVATATTVFEVRFIGDRAAFECGGERHYHHAVQLPRYRPDQCVLDRRHRDRVLPVRHRWRGPIAQLG